ncbi:unnamed protein product [Prunus armeniaca]|uniref:Wall-associated receptor kinase galacturonan-binding domain-containing protein n=1 Tax=Prunus armeniaca TaxID=36596 RepID=A0A6J5Y0Y3_PRUAR|nr:unnamed protein product [Prunus armeniaca]
MESFQADEGRVPVSCGQQDIPYSFYIQGKQERFCGYPRFQLSCHGDGEDTYPLLQLSGNNYTIHNINYQSKSLIVSNSLLSGYLDSTACNNDILSLRISFQTKQTSFCSTIATLMWLSHVLKYAPHQYIQLKDVSKDPERFELMRKRREGRRERWRDREQGKLEA